jgi:hypothetical protein
MSHSKNRRQYGHAEISDRMVGCAFWCALLVVALAVICGLIVWNR